MPPTPTAQPCPTRPPCSAALLVRPCIDLFKEVAPEVTTLIFTFLAFVFATAFTCASRGECGVGWVGLQCQVGRLPRDSAPHPPHRLALLGFVIMHARLCAVNKTTIEAYEKRPVK